MDGFERIVLFTCLAVIGAFLTPVLIYGGLAELWYRAGDTGLLLVSMSGALAFGLWLLWTERRWKRK